MDAWSQRINLLSKVSLWKKGHKNYWRPDIDANCCTDKLSSEKIEKVLRIASSFFICKNLFWIKIVLKILLLCTLQEFWWKIAFFRNPTRANQRWRQKEQSSQCVQHQKMKEKNRLIATLLICLKHVESDRKVFNFQIVLYRLLVFKDIYNKWFSLLENSVAREHSKNFVKETCQKQSA